MLVSDGCAGCERGLQCGVWVVHQSLRVAVVETEQVRGRSEGVFYMGAGELVKVTGASGLSVVESRGEAVERVRVSARGNF